jgi:hypothetical protein
VSVRTHASTKIFGERAEYTCEILDGGAKPLFKVTSSEDPDHPIVKDAMSGCWLEIVKKVEGLK